MLRELHVFVKLQALISDIDMHGPSGRITPKPDFPTVFCSHSPAVFSGLVKLNERAESTTVTGSSSPTSERLLVSQSQAGLLYVTACSIIHFNRIIARRIRWADGVSKLRIGLAVIRCS